MQEEQRFRQRPFRPQGKHLTHIFVPMQVIIFDPQYDAYIPLCVAQGGVPKAVKLNTEDWSVPHAGKHLVAGTDFQLK